jgi:photosystem II stability/assembly factor-like uncharacterized protein
MPQRNIPAYLPMFRCCLLLVALFVCLPGCTPPQEHDQQWKLLDGPYAREISALLPLAGSPGHLLAGMDNGAIYYSGSNGQTWEQRVPADPGNVLNAIVQHPDTPSCLFGCTNGGLFLTRDEARTWRQLIIGDAASRSPILCLTFDPWKNRTMYLGTGGHGVYRSTDNGTTWHAANGRNDSLLRNADVHAITVDPDRPDRVVAAIGTGGLALSENAGETWKPLIEGRTSVAASVTHVAIQPGGGTAILYTTGAGSIYYSSNRGETWSPSREATLGDRIRSLERVPLQPQYLIAGTERGIIASSDFGERWIQVAPALSAAGVSLVLGPGAAPRWYAFGEALGLQMSSDEGRSWTSIDEQLAGSTAQFVASDPSTDDLFAAVGSAILRKTPGAGKWRSSLSAFAGGTITSLTFDPLQRAVVYATSALGAFRSTNDGATWEPFARQLPSTPVLLAAHPWFASRLMLSTLTGNYVSTDRGATWKECQSFSKTPPARSFTFHPTDAGAVFAAAGAGGVLLSSDGGISWNAIRYGLDQDTLAFVTLDRNDRSVCYAWTAGGRCYRSLNSGLEWDRYSPPWEATDAVLLARDPASPSDLVALVNGQTLFLSMDGGTAWTRMQYARVPGEPTTISWNHEKSRLLAATRHGGIYQMDLAGLLSARERD